MSKLYSRFAESAAIRADGTNPEVLVQAGTGFHHSLEETAHKQYEAA